VVFPEFGDVVELDITDSINKPSGYYLDVRGPFANDIAGKPNLITLAVSAFLEEFQLKSSFDRLSISVVLHKNLPVAAGLGGGSANAAAVLRALSNYVLLQKSFACREPAVLTNTFQLRQGTSSFNYLSKVALQLGSDVPVCLRSRSSVVGNIGEVTSVIQTPQFAILLINSGVPVSTGEVFRRLPFLQRSRMPVYPRQFKNYDHFCSYVRDTRNDLTTVACQISPEIATIIDELRRCCGLDVCGMSGAGGTCFGVFEQLSAANTAKSFLQKKYPAWWCASSTVFCVNC